MSSTAERDQRILAGYRAGATIPQLCLAEEVAPQVVRRVLVAAGISPGAARQAKAANAALLADPTWLADQYETKSARLGRAEGQIAEELGCPRDRVYEALHAAGIPPRANGYGPPREEIPLEEAERVVSLYRAGWMAKDVAAELGLPVGRVTRLLDERGVKRSRREVAVLANAARREPPGAEPAPRRANRWPPEQVAEVLGRYLAGESGEEIAESLGLTPSRVYRLLRKHGVLRSRVDTRRMGTGGGGSQAVPKVRKEIPAELAEKIVARYAAGEPAGLVAAAVGVSDERVYRLLRARGVLRSRSEARNMIWARRRADVRT